MKSLILLMMISIIGSTSAQESCSLIERLRSDTKYLESKEAYLTDLYEENNLTQNQLIAAGSFYGAGSGYAVSKKYTAKAYGYISKIAANEVLLHPELIAKSNYKHLSQENRLLLMAKANKSLIKSKVATIAGITLAGLGAVLLIKDYQDKKRNYILKPYLITEIKDKDVLAKICNEIESNTELKASVTELAKKLFISRMKVEEIIANNGNTKLNDSDRKEIKETMKVVTKNLKNNRVNQ